MFYRSNGVVEWTRKPLAKEGSMHRIYSMAFSRVYPLYVTKVERKGRTQAELDEVILWLTGFSAAELQKTIADDITLDEFFAAARLHPNADLITGTICGVKIQEIEEPLMKKIRYMDKLVDELAKGRPMAKVLRTRPE
jgi:hypothetical protein